MSKLYFRYGAMNSGKSTNLLQVAHNYEERNMQVIIMKPKTDTKGENKVISRLGIAREVDFLVSGEENIFEMVENWREKNGTVDCILVDEVQFLKEKQVDQLFEIAVKLDIPTICYGLRTDFQMRGFEGSTRMLLLAHSIEELKTICKCGKKAILNGRKIKNNFVFEGMQIVIDNEIDIKYESLCARCYFDLKKEYENRKEK
ncbi:MAG: thymidine kinase [Bacillota bacterium]|nr:thymidine kinase [Bacillota bacterium]